MDSYYIGTALRQLNHRGPDGAGVFYSSLEQERLLRNAVPSPGQMVNWFLGHTRLSILDLDSRGLQPMVDAGSQTVLAYNGEVYNYKELRETLTKRGRKFYTGTDTEVVLQAYSEWGTGAFDKFDGMFALVILDFRRNLLTLARDVFGIKPLYYATNYSGLYVGSEVQTLLAFPQVSSRANLEQAYTYLRYGLTDLDNRTMFNDVYQVPPGTFIQCKYNPFQTLGEPVVYTTLYDTKEDISIGFTDAQHTVRDLFMESVQLHTRSDVPVGVSLSGGLDSTAVLYGAIEALPSSHLTAISYENTVTSLNERKWIDIASKGAAVNSVLFSIHPDSFLEEHLNLIRAQGEPVYSASVFAQYMVFRHAASQGLKVMLDGQGADELFGGYEHYVLGAFHSYCRAKRWTDVLSLLKYLATTNRYRLLWLLFRLSSTVLPKPIFALIERMVGYQVVPSWINREWLQSRLDLRSIPPENDGTSNLRTVMQDELRRISLPHLLRYQDRNSMASSVESRVPFLSKPLVEFTFRLPDRYFYSSSGVSKNVLRQALTGIVPDEILSRRDKLGFVAEDIPWLKGLISKDTGILHLIEKIPFFDLKTTEQVLTSSNAKQLWRIINFAEWSSEFNVNYE